MVTCKGCGEDFSELASHLRYNDCEWPEISNNQRDILLGSILGDGSVDWSGKNRRILIRNTNRDYLVEVSEKLGPLSHSITKEERDNRKDIYSLNTISHPEIESIVSDLYSGKEKVFTFFEPSPTVIRHWYYQDGSYHEGRCRIQMVNFSKFEKEITRFFKTSGIGEPYYDTSGGSFRAEFSVDQSKEFLEYIEPEDITVFSYKFP